MSEHQPGLYGSHLEEYEERPTAPRRGSKSGPEGGVRQAVKQVPAETNPATLARTSTAGKSSKTRAGSAQKLAGYK